jgi:hypothetical protein
VSFILGGGDAILTSNLPPLNLANSVCDKMYIFERKLFFQLNVDLNTKILTKSNLGEIEKLCHLLNLFF